jgi:hypothetical protein
MILEILNLDKLINFSRRLVFFNFDDQNNEDSDADFLAKVNNIQDKDDSEMEMVLPFDECKAIFQELVKQKVSKKTKRIKYLMKESDYDKILAMLNDRMVSNIIKGLVSKGLVESAFDSEKNDFIFWVKTNNEKPETD